MKRTWTIIGVGNVPRSFKWYQALFGQPVTPKLHTIQSDVADPAQIAALAIRVKSELPKLDG